MAIPTSEMLRNASIQGLYDILEELTFWKQMHESEEDLSEDRQTHLTAVVAAMEAAEAELNKKLNQTPERCARGYWVDYSKAHFYHTDEICSACAQMEDAVLLDGERECPRCHAFQSVQ